MIHQKKCSKCKLTKLANKFNHDENAKSGLRSWCKCCTNKIGLKIRRTKSGLLNRIYHHQKESSKRRGHNPPEYSAEEFRLKYLGDATFIKLYNDWAESGYNKMMCPSFDRERDSEGYSFDNIQLMTWQENNDKANKDMRYGRLKHGNKPQKAVIGTNIKTGESIEFPSIREAARNGFQSSCISLCCRRISKTHSGYVWEYL